MHTLEIFALVAVVIATGTAAAFAAYVVRQHPSATAPLTVALLVVSAVAAVAALGV